MTEELYLNELRSYLLAEDRWQITINGYVSDVRRFARWFVKHNQEALLHGFILRNLG